MNLDGGLFTYTNGRYNGGEKPLGRKVRYLGVNGEKWSRDYANRFFEKGQILEVREIYVGITSSEVGFLDIPHEEFNTVMFEDVDEEETASK